MLLLLVQILTRLLKNDLGLKSPHWVDLIINQSLGVIYCLRSGTFIIMLHVGYDSISHRIKRVKRALSPRKSTPGAELKWASSFVIDW